MIDCRCYDKLVQQMGPDPSKYTGRQIYGRLSTSPVRQLTLTRYLSESQMMAMNEKLDKCVAQCADEHIKLLPKIKDRIVSSLKD